MAVCVGRAAITNMQSVKRFLARGKVQAPFSENSDPPRWRLVGTSKLGVTCCVSIVLRKHLLGGPMHALFG